MNIFRQDFTRKSFSKLELFLDKENIFKKQTPVIKLNLHTKKKKKRRKEIAVTEA